MRLCHLPFLFPDEQSSPQPRLDVKNTSPKTQNTAVTPHSAVPASEQASRGVFSLKPGRTDSQVGEPSQSIHTTAAVLCPRDLHVVHGSWWLHSPMVVIPTDSRDSSPSDRRSYVDPRGGMEFREDRLLIVCSTMFPLQPLTSSSAGQAHFFVSKF